MYNTNIAMCVCYVCTCVCVCVINLGKYLGGVNSASVWLVEL